MSKFRRIRTFLGGLFTILLAIFMICVPAAGAPLISLILGITFGGQGITTLLYYFSMAIYMVDGKQILYKGLMLFSMGIFMLVLTQVPTFYIMIYLIICHAFTGLVDLLNALESRKMKVASWPYGFIRGLFGILFSLVCLLFIDSTNIMVYLYSATLILRSLSSMITATRRTAMVYIQ